MRFHGSFKKIINILPEIFLNCDYGALLNKPKLFFLQNDFFFHTSMKNAFLTKSRFFTQKDTDVKKIFSM